MDMHRKTLLVMLAEAALEKPLIADVRALGATGYTVTDARGSGPRGDRAATWEADRAVRIEVICDEQLAGRIAERVRDRYFANYAVSLYVTDALVFRPEKY
jgi:Nitrogen regulatory protein P-II